MPPHKKISKEEIVSAALRMMQKTGENKKKPVISDWFLFWLCDVALSFGFPFLEA